MDMFEGYSMFSYIEQDNMKVTAHFYTKYQYCVKFDPETKFAWLPWFLPKHTMVTSVIVTN